MGNVSDYHVRVLFRLGISTLLFLKKIIKGMIPILLFFYLSCEVLQHYISLSSSFPGRHNVHFPHKYEKKMMRNQKWISSSVRNFPLQKIIIIGI